MNHSNTKLLKMIHDVSLLEALLEREKKVLAGPPTSKLHDIGRQKQDLLSRLSAYGLNEDSLDSLGVETREVLERCRELNRENNLLVNQKLKVLRQVNTLYRQQTNNNTVALYDQMGKMVLGRNRRSVTEI